MKQLSETLFQLPGSQAGCTNRAEQWQRDFAARGYTDFAIHLLSLEHIDVQSVFRADRVFTRTHIGHCICRNRSLPQTPAPIVCSFAPSLPLSMFLYLADLRSFLCRSP